MSEEIVIKVEDVRKKFKIYFDKGQSLKERLLFKNRSHYENRWVLNSISFEVKKGEALGLVGENGCGKSTMLKMLTKIMYPDNGKIEIKGRISSLIELGAGFHPDMSGRENIYTNASIFGLSKSEIDKKLNDIINFSELKDFIDNPVRTYSSGMYMRLAFSVAINVDADVILIDEILAVGDINFQRKCFNRLEDLKNSGVTIILVTHDMGTIEKFCSNAVWINEGVVKRSGNSSDVVNEYLRYMNNRIISNAENESNPITETAETSESVREGANEEGTGNTENIVNPKKEYEFNEEYHWGNKEVEITDAYIKNSKGERTTVIISDEPISVVIEYKINKEQDEYIFGAGLCGHERQMYFGTNTQIDGLRLSDIPKKGAVSLRCGKTNYLAGEYILHVSVINKFGADLDFYKYHSKFTVVCDDKAVGFVNLEREWIV